MSLKEQIGKIKDNWLMVLLVVIVLGAMMFSGSGIRTGSSYQVGYDSSAGMGIMESAVYKSTGSSDYYPSYNSDFAPEVEERMITKYASFSSEIERGEFADANAKLKALIVTSNSYLLNENVYKNGEGNRAYMNGYYSIKVETKLYDAFMVQLKEIGEVQSFSENANDITGQYTNTAIELAAAYDKLDMYKEMYEEADRIEDKINLADRIFSQERTIKYLEQSLENMDNRVDYSTVAVTFTEEQSGYANIAIVKFSELIRSLVRSLNSVFSLFFMVIPWALAIFIIWLISKPFRRKK
ncbi:MAG: DUF4349 domain-containing protein [archaeon]